MENLPELVSPGTHRCLRSQKSTRLLSKQLCIKTYLCQHTSTAEMVEDGCKVIYESFFATISDKGMQTPEPPRFYPWVQLYEISFCLYLPFLSYYSKDSKNQRIFPTYVQIILSMCAILVSKWIRFNSEQFCQTLNPYIHFYHKLNKRSLKPPS